jgi:hypothetical protein
MIAGTSADADLLNKRAQDLRREAGELGALHVEADGERFYRGDRVRFTKSARVYGVKNGGTGTVTAVEPLTKNLVVRLDEGRHITVPLHRFDCLRLGYAAAAWEGPGATVDNAYFLLGGGRQEEAWLREQASRSRNEVQLFSGKALDSVGVRPSPGRVEGEETRVTLKHRRPRLG